MGAFVVQQPVKLICGIMWNSAGDPDQAIAYLEKSWGPVAARSPVFDFNFTTYYLDESGPDLKKQYLAFEKLVNIEQVPEIKIASNAIESAHFMNGGKRTVNIDPGYIADAKLVMATTKNLPHRVYIGRNIYADLQLMFKKPGFFPISWTFGDIRQPSLIEFFNQVRERYILQLREEKA